MANLTVNPTVINITEVNQNTVAINFTSDETLTDVKLSTDGGSTYKDKISMTQNSATFDIASMNNNNYTCKLKGYYEENVTIPVTDITVDSWDVALTVGQSRQMIASVVPSNATNQRINWYSDYTSIANVTQTGLITAIGEGYTKVTATTDDGGYRYEIHVNVSSTQNGGNDNGSSGGSTSSNLTVGNSYTIKSNETLELSYTTSVSIPSSCAWELRKDGSYLCGAYRDTTSGKIVCYTGGLSLGTYNNITLVAKEYQSNGYVDIATSNTFSITVGNSSSGGSDSGSGGSGGSSGTISSGIKTDPTSVTVSVGAYTDVTMLFGSDVTNKSMEYMSSNGSVASVSDLGSYKYRITGVGQGQTTIRFRTSDGKFETSCSVTVTGGSSGGGGSTGGDTSTSSEYAKSCTSEYILDKMYPMGQRHEAIPSGLITDTWKHNSRWENQYRPTAVAHGCGVSNCPGTGPFKALGCWSNIYRVEGTPFTQNTAVEMKDIKVYGWYNGKWELVQHLPVPNGNFYPESFGGDVNKYFADSVKQTSTSKTIILREANKIQAMNWSTGQLQTENCMYHPFSDVKSFDTKYEYIYTCIDLRKVKWDEKGVDDRDQTHYCSNCGGDWWLAEGLMFHDSWQHNKGVAQPKMIEITKEWRRFSMTTVPQGWSNGFPK